MEAKEIQCPACGAGQTIYNPGLVTLVCAYCGNAVYWDAQGLQSLGKQSLLPEGFSRLYRGAAGSLLHKRFVVSGRVRYSFGQGFWDEWFLEFADGTMAWLAEDNHEFALEKPVLQANIPPFKTLAPGAWVQLNQTKFMIEEVGTAECLGVEGAVPIVMHRGERYAYADGATPDGRYTFSIEYDATPPTVFVGHWLKYAALQLDQDGIDW